MFCRQVYGGISRYFAELLKHVPQETGHAVRLDLWWTWNHYLRRSSHVRWQVPAVQDKLKGIWLLECAANRFLSQKNLRKQAFDLFHPTYYDPYFLKNLGGRPFVLTIHDMIHERFRAEDRSDPTIAHKRLLAEKAAAIIAVSEATRQDVLQFYPSIDPGKIHVVYHGNSLQAPAEKPVFGLLPINYLLFVGSRGGYKNFAWMLREILPLLKSQPELHLVCAGGRGFTAAELALFREMNLGPQLLQLSVDDHALYRLYAGACCFIFPSRYEGFGIPVLEAFSAGCPVLLNRTSSLPEVGGEAALYFEENAAPEQGLLAGLHRLLGNENLRHALVEKGRARLQLFSWAQTARATSMVYEAALANL